jgi:hypothetical protein
MPSLVDGTMDTKICMSKVHAVPAPFSLAQQQVRLSKYCWVRKGITGFKYEVGRCNHVVYCRAKRT